MKTNLTNQQSNKGRIAVVTALKNNKYGKKEKRIENAKQKT